MDFGLEFALRELIGIQVRACTTVSASDFKGLLRLRDVCGASFFSGVVLRVA